MVIGVLGIWRIKKSLTIGHPTCTEQLSAERHCGGDQKIEQVMRTSVLSNRQDSAITNPIYQHILADKNLQASKDYLDLMNNFYFKVMRDAAETKDTLVNSELRCLVQMMFTKGVSLRRMLDGFSFVQGDVHLNTITDHTLLNTIARTMFESLMGFELITRIPDTNDKRTILQNVWCASSLTSRLKMFTSEAEERFAERFKHERENIDYCKDQIYKTELYSRLGESDKKEIEKSIKRGEYQLIIDTDEHVKRVAWDEVRQYCDLRTDNLHGVYKYLCNMAHPSYYALMQFKDSYKGDSPAFVELACMASKNALVFMSVFIMDYMLVFPDTQHSFEELDAETQFMICLYNDIMRKVSMK